MKQKEQGSVRLIDELGRIVLPAEVRSAMEWGDKTPVEIRINAADNEVTIRRFTSSCIYCGKMENLREYLGRHICPECRESIANLLW